MSKAHVCNGRFYFENQFILVRDLNQDIILGTPFIAQIYPFKISHKGTSTYIGGFWQVQIHEDDRYKIAFNVPFEQYE